MKKQFLVTIEDKNEKLVKYFETKLYKAFVEIDSVKISIYNGNLEVVEEVKEEVIKETIEELDLVSVDKNGKVECFFDGATAPTNPGGTSSIGVFIKVNGKSFHKHCEVLDIKNPEESTNNVAEYNAIFYGMKYLVKSGFKDENITFIGDSSMTINQLFGSWKIKQGVYVKKAYEVRNYLWKYLPRAHGKWVNRELNTIADELSKKALAEKGIIV